MTFVSDSNFAWGIVANKMPLPKGWQYVECSTSWLKALGPDGKMWLTNGRGNMTEAVPSSYEITVKGWAAGTRQMELLPSIDGKSAGWARNWFTDEELAERAEEAARNSGVLPKEEA